MLVFDHQVLLEITHALQSKLHVNRQALLPKALSLVPDFLFQHHIPGRTINYVTST